MRNKSSFRVLILISMPSFLALGWAYAEPASVSNPAGLEGQNPPYKLTEDQVSQGAAQLEKMLKDRPEMARYIRKGDGLWDWTVRQFAGESIQGGVQWDPGDPQGSFDSISCRPDPLRGKSAYIQVTRNYAVPNFHQGEPKTGPTLWYEAGIEFCNLISAHQFQTIDEEADRGQLSRDDFAFEMMAVENIVTNGNFHEFFYGIWMPNCQKLSVPFEDKRFIERYGTTVGKGWKADEYLKFFKLLSDEEGARALPGYQQMSLRDIKAHYDFYTGFYDKEKKPYQARNGVQIPSKLDWPAREKFLAGLPIGRSGEFKLSPSVKSFLVDDFETGLTVNRLGGSWATMMDQNGLGTEMNPRPFEPVTGGCPRSSKGAAHIWGHLGKNIAPWPFAQLWNYLTPEASAVDLSAFTSFRFYCKGDKRNYSLDVGRTAVTDYAYFQAPFQATSEWAQVTLPFTSFQQPNWGQKVPAGWNDIKILIFAVDPSNGDQNFDLWVDNVEIFK